MPRSTWGPRTQHQVCPGVDRSVGEPAQVASVLAERVLVPARDVQLVHPLRAAVEEHHHEIGPRAAAPRTSERDLGDVVIGALQAYDEKPTKATLGAAGAQHADLTWSARRVDVRAVERRAAAAIARLGRSRTRGCWRG